MARSPSRTFRATDGSLWGIEVDNLGASNATVLFRNANPGNSRGDRYAWFISKGPEARSVTSRLSAEKVLDLLDDSELSRLFRRSMPVSRPDPLLPAQASNG